MARGNDRTYILITAVKDEVRYLGKCIRSVVEQTTPPSLWVIVDDGSTDGTEKIIRQAVHDNDWIHTINSGASEWDPGEHLYNIYTKGIDHAFTLCITKNIDWGYISILDGDMVVEKGYYEKILAAFDENEQLGIVSGSLYSCNGGKISLTRSRSDLPWGGGRVWRRKCYYDAPYENVISGDGISNIKARFKGWRTKIIQDAMILHLRPMGGAKRKTTYAFTQGKSNYFFGSTPIFALLRCMRMLLIPPSYPAMWYLYGYFSSRMKNEERIGDPDILEYYEKSRFQEIKKLYFDELKKRMGST